jgi:hypothetical protein
MKLALFRELVDLNRAFEEVIRGLERMERVGHFQRDLIRYARGDVETARVDANREFFDNFEALVEDDASWAYRFQREHKQEIKDPDDIYFDLKDSEERRQKKGLPPRVVILPGWDMSDEERYDEQRAERKNGPRGRRRARSLDAGSALQRVKSGRRMSLLLRPQVKASNEKQESSKDAKEGFTHPWEAVSRHPRQDRGLGRARFRGRDDVRAGALHRPNGIVLDATDGSRNQGSRPERLENWRLQTTETVRRE